MHDNINLLRVQRSNRNMNVVSFIPEWREIATCFFHSFVFASVSKFADISSAGPDSLEVEWLRDMWDEAMGGVKSRLLGSSVPSGLLFVGERPDGLRAELSPKMDHLVKIPGDYVLFILRLCSGVHANFPFPPCFLES
jgi:hypothetical protein